MDSIDLIFHRYHNKNIVMNPQNEVWNNFLEDLMDYYQSEEDVSEFMSTLADEYAEKHNITFMEPEEFDVNINQDVLPQQAPSDDYQQQAAFEIKRMQELAGLYEEEEEYGPEEEEETKEIISQDHVLTFNSEEDRDRAIMYYKDPNNHPKEVLKHTRGKLQMQPEDAVSIIFPTQANQQACGLDENKLKGIVEIMHRHINKKYPNSKTMKIESK